MKKLWLVLLSLGLVMAFSVSAFAVDVKVGAEYFVGGLYLKSIAVDNGFESWAGDTGSHNPSTAFFFQRLRVGTDFIVSPCLKLVTRITAMERIWGGERSEAGGSWPENTITSNTGGTAGTRAESENIAFDLVYIDYTSPVGLFRVGYMPDYTWGTVFNDRSTGMPSGQIMYAVPIGPVNLILDYSKEYDNSFSAVNSSSYSAYRTDRDLDSYRIAGIYNFKGGEAGALFLWNRDATHRGWGMTGTFPFDAAFPYSSNIFVIDPYVKAKIGPVTLQAEAQYWFGNALKYEYGLGGSPLGGGYYMNDVSVSAISAFVDATANFGMFYFGGSFAYLSGDDHGTSDKVEGSGSAGMVNTGGLDWNPCLILFNNELNYWAGDVYGHTNTVVNSEMSNAWFGQLRAGVKPTPQLDVMLAVSYAQADKKLANYTSATLGFYGPYVTSPGGTYGTEVDLTANYKITNNLTYMLGAGYLFTGDYFKGKDNNQRAGNADVQDDFILLNKLTLSF